MKRDAAMPTVTELDTAATANQFLRLTVLSRGDLEDVMLATDDSRISYIELEAVSH